MSEPHPADSPLPSRPPDGGAAASDLLLPLLCLAGLCVSAYLSLMHFGLLLGDLSLGGACGGAAWADCNSVIASRFGRLLGLPVAVWGMCYYIAAGALAMGIVLLRRADTPPFARALVWLTALALTFDFYLAWAMWWRLGHLCSLCAATYGVNVAILLLSARSGRPSGPVPGGMRSLLPAPSVLLHPAEPAYYREVVKLVLAGASAAGCVVVLALSLAGTRTVMQGEREKLASLLGYLARIEPSPIPIGVQPARGPSSAPVTIVVFSDFLCEQCKLASRYLDVVAANHRGTLRIVHVNTPADAACNPRARGEGHPGACLVARAAACAHRQGRFWPFHDAVFADPGRVKAERIPLYAARAGLDPHALQACLGDSASADSLRAEIALANGVGVDATPAIALNGRLVVGALKPWMLEAALAALGRPPPPVPQRPKGP